MEQLGEEFDPVAALKNMMYNLVDAVGYAKKSVELEDEVQTRTQFYEKKFKKLDTLMKEVEDTVRSFADTEDMEEEFKALGSKIAEFTEAAGAQTRKELQDKLDEELEALKREVEANRIKALKSVETYFSMNPLPLLDKSVSIKAVGDAYEARAHYVSPGEIEYEFLLDTKNVDLFENELAFSKLMKGLKVAVKLANNWLKKEGVAGYEKLDQYLLSYAEVSKRNTVAIFTHEQSEKKFTFVYSRSETQSFIEVKYEDSMGAVDVNADPRLNRYLDSEPLKEALETLTLALRELEKHKMRLAKLTYGGKDLVQSLELGELLLASSKILSQDLGEALSVKGFNELFRDDLLQFVEHLKLLGQEGLQVASFFGIESLVRRELRQ